MARTNSFFLTQKINKLKGHPYSDLWAALNCNELQWLAMICDDVQWTSMIYNELRWSTNFDDLQWTSMIYDELWWSKMNFDDLRWTSMINDELWWSTMNFDDQLSTMIFVIIKLVESVCQCMLIQLVSSNSVLVTSEKVNKGLLFGLSLPAGVPEPSSTLSFCKIRCIHYTFV